MHKCTKLIIIIVIKQKCPVLVFGMNIHTFKKITNIKKKNTLFV